MLQIYGVGMGGRSIQVLASFFRLEEVEALPGQSQGVKVRADGQDLGEYLPGDSIQVPVTASNWEVVPISATATARVRLGVAGVGSSRIFGAVEVIDSGVNATMQGTEFFGSSARSLVTATNFAIIGVKAGEKAAQVSELSLTTSSSALVTLYACNGDATVNPANAPGFGRNKKLDITDVSLASIISGESVTATPTAVELPGVRQFGTIRCQANTPTGIPLTKPLYLPTGFGIVAVPNVANVTIFMSADFREK